MVILCQLILLSSITPTKTYASTKTLKDRLKNTVVICTNSTKSYVNNKQIWVDASDPLVVPVTVNKVTLVPLKFLKTSFKAGTTFNSKTKEITIKYGGKTCKLKLGSKKMTIKGKSFQLPQPPQTIRGETYIPLKGIVDKVFGKTIFSYSDIKVIGDKKNLFNAKTEKGLLGELTNLFEESQLSKRTVYLDKVQVLLPKSFHRLDQNELTNTLGNDIQLYSGYANDSNDAVIAFQLLDNIRDNDKVISSTMEDLIQNKNNSRFLSEGQTVTYTSLKKVNGKNLGIYEVIIKDGKRSIYSAVFMTAVDNGILVGTFLCDKKDMIKWQNSARRVANSLRTGLFTDEDESIVEDQAIDGVSLDYKVSDALIDSKDSILYITDKENKKLHKVNYTTGKEVSITFDLPPEKMAVDEKYLYVTLTKKEHSAYTFDKDQEGAIAIIDLKTFKLKDQFDVATDPYGIAVGRDGYLYVSSGSGQHTTLKSYSIQSKQETASAGIDDADIIQMHPSMNRIYSCTSGVSPIDSTAYNVENGNFTEKSYPGGYDSPYHGDYSMSPQFKISTDGKYIFNYAGTIFGCSNAVDYDMKYISKLDTAFTSITFALDKDTFFTSATGKVIKQYKYSTFKKQKSYKLQGEGQYLFYRDSKIVAISTNANGGYFIETLKVSDLGSSATNNTGNNTGNNTVDSSSTIPVNAEISDAVMDPEKPIMYLVDAANSKVYAINFEKSSKKEIKLNLPPERIAYNNGKLYVTLLKMKHSSYTFDEDQEGAVAIIDAQTMSLSSQFDIDVDPFDIEADKEGYIYISSGSGQFTNVKIYNENSKKEMDSRTIRQQSYIAFNPIDHKLYTIDTDTSPRDMCAYLVKDGSFGENSYDSPYHGDYSMDTNIRISPDGKYIFNGAGTIFACSSNQKEDMKYVSKLNKGFIDIAFDVDSNRFYTALKGKYIYSYKYSTFEGVNTYKSKGEVKYLYHQNNQLIALSLTDDNRYIIEKIAIE